jgi:chromosome partitioning protein
MLKIGFVSQKGGVGKSTLCRALAREAAANQLHVKLADLDPQQGTSTKWHSRRLIAGVEPVFSVEQFATARQALTAAERSADVDVLLIDGPARASQGTVEIARAVDLVVQPTGASLDDLEPAVLLFHELKAAGISVAKMAFALCRIGTKSEEKRARAYLEKTTYQVLEGCLLEKPGYRTAMNSGYVLTESRYDSLNEKADVLIQSLIDRMTANVKKQKTVEEVS